MADDRFCFDVAIHGFGRKHIAREDDDSRSMCGEQRAPLTALVAAHPRTILRCRRGGCRQIWERIIEESAS